MMRIGKAQGRPPSLVGTRARGKIVRVVTGQSYGFIRLRDRREVFFHRADVQEDTPFNSLQPGDAVTFELIADAISGPRAIRVTRNKRASGG